jgi:hypothetical protein
MDYSANTEAWADMFHNLDIISQQMCPIFMQLELLSEKMFVFLYQQAMIDVQMESFCGIGHLTTLLGQKPPLFLLPASPTPLMEQVMSAVK